MALTAERLKSTTPGSDQNDDNRARASEIQGKDQLYTAPSPEHYRHLYLWDSCFVAVVYAREGNIRKAQEEMHSVFEGQRPNGFIPNQQKAKKARPSDKFNFEDQHYMDPELGSDYTQPPLMAQAIWEIWEACERAGQQKEGRYFLEEMYPKLAKAYDFFRKESQNADDDPLVFNIHPHETGRDSDPTFDFFKTRLEEHELQVLRHIKVKGVPLNQILAVGVDYMEVVKLNKKLKKVGWDRQKAREIFSVNDVMFNTMYADNLHNMSLIAGVLSKGETNVARKEKYQRDSQEYLAWSGSVEQAITKRMWAPNAKNGRGGFYALDKEGTKIDVTSISNLFPLQMRSLSAEQLESLLDTMDEEFNTNYPLPSVSTKEPTYDPEHKEVERLWRGSTWINTNWCIVQALQMQADRVDMRARRPDLVDRCKTWADRIHDMTLQIVVKNEGYPEFASPNTGEGQRIAEPDELDFAWSTLAHVMDEPKQVEIW